MSKIQIASNNSEQPTLYAQGVKKSDMLEWNTRTEGPVVFFSHGKQGFKQTESKYTAEAVNIGKANFRDPIAQAKFESEAAWRAKIKEGYYVTVEEAKTNTVIRPMKAHRMDRQGHKLRYDCHAQPKLNGYRCLAICADNGHLFLMSNGGETWNVPHILEELRPVLKPGSSIDGELYIHGVSLQNIGSLVKANRPESAALELHCYDFPQKDGKIYDWADRYDHLTDFFVEVTKVNKGYLGKSKLKLVETVLLHNEKDLDAFNAKVIAAGYEGVMLRNLHNSPYRYNYRSYDIFKLKHFSDNEFLVTGMKKRTHSINGVDTVICDVCVCRNNLNDDTFEVVPRGDIATKAEFWEHRDKYIGSRLVVRYLERSDMGIPQGNPVGIAFRLEEDMAESEPDMFSGEDS
jgi:DNA ligase-1